MAAVVPIPVSQILKSKAAESGAEEPLKKSREEWRKAKELEEARKAGTAPAAVDEEGRDINPHIPQYISAAPWYYNTRGPTLKHQRQPGEDNKDQYATVGEWYNRGVDTSSIATRYRKGACENCGAMTHQKKECMERPRRIGAKFTGAEIAPDEFVQPDFKLDFDGKRDRWNGYDAQEYTAIIEDFKKVEDAKRQLKTDKIMSGNADGDKEEEEEDDDEEDEDKYVDEVDMPGTKVDSKQRITVRNLRIREDTAKYLRNLDPTSAYYDPKTRSMRDNPYKNTGKNPDEVGYAGENFVRFSGDTAKQATAQLFAWEAGSAGFEVNLIAEPTKLEKLQVEYSKKREEIKHHVQESLLERYGGREHLEAPPKALLLAQTEDYVEYSRTGKIIRGGEKVVVRSRYEEDVFINNHISVWGSWWREGQWGFKCCHSTVKNSYCTGEAGVVANEPVKGQLALPPPSNSASAPPSDAEVEQKHLVSRVESQSEEEKSKATPQVDKEKKRQKKKEKKRKQKKNRKRRHSTSSSSSESDEEEDKAKKLKIALEKKAKEDAIAEKILEMGERKRSYNSMKADVAVPTEEDMEAYYMKRKREEDPMAAFL